MKRKLDKDVTIARMSLNQAIAVALIGLCSAVAVAMIVRHDKVPNPNVEARGEIGFYEGRATAVEQEVSETEQDVRFLSLTAERAKDTKTVERLSRLEAEFRAKRAQFQLLHQKHLEALRDQKPVEASKIRLETNALIQAMNRAYDAGVAAFEMKIPPGVDSNLIIAEFKRLTHRQRIPLYGKGEGVDIATEAAE